MHEKKLMQGGLIIQAVVLIVNQGIQLQIMHYMHIKQTSHHDIERISFCA